MADQIFERDVHNVVVLQPKEIGETCRQERVLEAADECMNVVKFYVGQDRLVAQESNCRDPGSMYETCEPSIDTTWATKFKGRAKDKELPWKRIEPTDFKPLYGIKELT